MTRQERLASRLFLAAGIYGILALLPQYFMAGTLGEMFPPPMTHPENFYAFIGIALVFQWVFLIISTDVQRYRVLMLPSAAEKLVFFVTIMVLFLQGQVSAVATVPAVIDLVLGMLFLWAYAGTRLRVSVM